MPRTCAPYRYPWQARFLLSYRASRPCGGLNVVLICGHGSVRVSRKEFGGPDIFKAGVFGEGGDIPELVELIALHDQLIESFHGTPHPA